MESFSLPLRAKFLMRMVDNDYTQKFGAAMPINIPNGIQIIGMARESCVKPSMTIESQARRLAVPRKANSFRFDRSSFNILPRVSKYNEIKDQNPRIPVSDKMRMYKFLVFG